MKLTSGEGVGAGTGAGEGALAVVVVTTSSSAKGIVSITIASGLIVDPVMSDNICFTSVILALTDAVILVMVTLITVTVVIWTVVNVSDFVFVLEMFFARDFNVAFEPIKSASKDPAIAVNKDIADTSSVLLS